MKKFVVLTVIAIFSMALVGCETTTNTNTNVRTNANTNMAANNTIIVTNANNMNMANTKADNDWDADITEEEANKDKAKYQERAKGLGDTVGQGAKDVWYWTKARAALAAVDDLRDSTINVDVNNGVVTLRGTVANAAHKSAAEKAAKVEGVTSVKNELKVSAGDSMTNQMTSGNGATSNANTNKK